MKELKQNSLDQATTEVGFVKTLNENAEEVGTEKVYLTREVELDDGTKVMVEGITPEKMKNVLNNHIGEDTVTFQTPGERVPTTEGEIKGVVQVYNEALSDDLAISSLSNSDDSEEDNESEDVLVTYSEEDKEDTNTPSLADPISE